MTPSSALVPEFVEFIPEDLADGTLYISIPYATAVHSCCCGCRNEVVTPLTPTDWSHIFDGESVSLDPSIGNWNFDCQSHYWISRNEVHWAARWSRREIDAGRARDHERKATYFSGAIPPEAARPPVPEVVSRNILRRLVDRLLRR
jgi:hypothetical protein